LPRTLLSHLLLLLAHSFRLLGFLLTRTFLLLPVQLLFTLLLRLPLTFLLHPLLLLARPFLLRAFLLTRSFLLLAIQLLLALLLRLPLTLLRHSLLLLMHSLLLLAFLLTAAFRTVLIASARLRNTVLWLGSSPLFLLFLLLFPSRSVVLLILLRVSGKTESEGQANCRCFYESELLHQGEPLIIWMQKISDVCLSLDGIRNNRAGLKPGLRKNRVNSAAGWRRRASD